MRARARGDARLAREQRAEILKADLVGQQRERQRADIDLRQSLRAASAKLPLSHAHATPQRNAKIDKRRRSGDNATVFLLT